MGETPEIRFDGFTDAWEQRKLGDVIEKLTGGASIAPDDYVDEGYRTIPKGAVNASGVADMSGCKNVSEDFFKKNISSKTSSDELVTSLRDLVPTAPNMGRIVRICGDSEDFLMPQGVYSIIVKEKISEDFLIAYSNSPEYRKIIMAEKNGSTQVHIRNGEFLNIDIPLPSYEEQRRIGEQFKNLDHLITLHQRKCEKLQVMKKSMLEKMFPKQGSNVPEIRFDGFTDAWEQRKLGDVCQITMGQSPDGSTYSDEPSDYILVQGNADLKDGWVFPRIWTTQKTKIAQAGDLIMSVRAPAGAMGKTAYDVVLGRGVAGIKGNEFVYQTLVKYDADGYWKKLAAGSTFESINSDVVNNVMISIPLNEAEQDKIGAYFSNLDHLITLHQRKYEKLLDCKKAFLTKMFGGES